MFSSRNPFIDGESLEELAPPLEDGLQRRNQQRFPETPWTGEEILPFFGAHQIPDIRGLVNIQEIIRDDPRKIKCAGVDVFHASPACRLQTIVL